jgi:hypothetical protein
MKSEPNTPRVPINRLAQGDPLHRLVEQAYRAFDAPAPRHVPGCGCALCADRAQARMLASRSARDWTAEEVRGWFARVVEAETGRNGLRVASRTDRAVFRFLAPRVLEMVATGALPADAPHRACSPSSSPGAWRRAGAEPDDHAAFRVASARPGAAGPGLAARSDLDPAPLASGGWSLPQLVQQAQIDPDLPAGLSRAWSPLGRDDSLFPGTWPPGAVSALRAAFVTPLMVERMMNYAMAEGTSHRETDDAMRAADLLLRNF